MSANLFELAMETVSRAASSEVLTLNLTSLMILLVLKAIIFGFGFFSFGGIGNHARSASDELVKTSDMAGGMCFLMFTSGSEEKLSCIQKAACEDPKTASDYITAAKMMFKLHKMLGLNFAPSYEIVMDAVMDAKSYSIRGGDCAIYSW